MDSGNGSGRFSAVADFPDPWRKCSKKSTGRLSKKGKTEKDTERAEEAKRNIADARETIQSDKRKREILPVLWGKEFCCEQILRKMRQIDGIKNLRRKKKCSKKFILNVIIQKERIRKF